MLNPFQVRVVAAWLSGYRRIALRAGWGSGKSRALGVIAWLAGEQGTDVLWATDSGPRIQTVVQPVCEELLRPAGWRYNSQKNCWTKNGATIWLRSYFRQGTRSAEANSIEGVNVGLVLLDEAQVFRDDEVLRKLFGRARTGTVTPAIVMAGLPVWGAWWEAAAEKMGSSGRILHGTSFDNLANLRPEWLADAPETLGKEEFEAMLLNKPRPPEGQIYSCWSAEPGGNVIDGWQWSPTMRTVWSIDPGSAKPSATLWAEDLKLKAWVLCGEVNPHTAPTDPTLTPELARAMCGVAWPRHLAASKPPEVKFLVDAAIADPNAKRRDRNRETGQRARSDIQILSEPPAGLGAPGQSGIGLRPYVLDGTMPDYADRTDVRAGIIRVRIAMGLRKLLCTREVWDAGQAKGRSFRKAVVGYRNDAWGQPVRFEGYDDVMDTVRYLVRWPGAPGLWTAHAFDGARMVAAPTGNPYAVAMGER